MPEGFFTSVISLRCLMAFQSFILRRMLKFFVFFVSGYAEGEAGAESYE